MDEEKRNPMAMLGVGAGINQLAIAEEVLDAEEAAIKAAAIAFAKASNAKAAPKKSKPITMPPPLVEAPGTPSLDDQMEQEEQEDEAKRELVVCFSNISLDSSGTDFSFFLS